MNDGRFVRLSLSLVCAGIWSLPGLASAYDEPASCRYPLQEVPAGPWRDLDRVDEPIPPAADLCLSWNEEERAPSADRFEDLRRRLARARQLAESGRLEEASLQLRHVASMAPEIADRMALEEAELRMAAEPDERACEAFETATESPHRTVATRAELGLCRCHLLIGDREGVDELETLRRRYPELTERERLELALGAAHEGWGEPEEAVSTYRRIDLLAPGSPFAAIARERLEALAAAGVEVRPFNDIQQVDRLERLVSTGPMPAARAETLRLLADESLRTSLRQQVARSAARIARVEGRWADAQRYLREAQGLPTLEPEEREAIAARVTDLGRAAESRTAEDVRRRLRGVTRGERLTTQGTARLFAALRLAVRGGLVEETNEVLRVIVERDRIPPGLRFDAAILGSGTGDDRLIAALFQGAQQHPRYGVAARYHHARALERLGRAAQARAELRRVVADDSTVLPYYALWARQRLRALAPRPVEVGEAEPAPIARLDPPPACEEGPFSPFDASKVGQAEPSIENCCLPSTPPPNPYLEGPEPEEGSETEAEPFDALAEADAAATEAELDEDTPDRPSFELSDEEIIELLETLVEEQGEFFPWLGRALTLVKLGELDAAGDELHETYLAWRDARGVGSLRAGLAGVLRGSAPPRHRVTGATWRGRRMFPSRAQADLARVSAALGDFGLAIRLGGFDVAGRRPRAYEHIVEDAAQRHGVEPELLFAVMRVESVYNPRIISYASAIGLMQIMPRTGRLIADGMERDDFTVDQLLEPEVNIEFAAWYLASLIERFDGRLPLAIASYNGGPHNVRRWMRDYSEDMPLDAFLETIPFEQTHRYVRRVLTHYEAYRAQRGLAPNQLDVELPPPAIDHVAF